MHRYIYIYMYYVYTYIKYIKARNLMITSTAELSPEAVLNWERIGDWSLVVRSMKVHAAKWTACLSRQPLHEAILQRYSVPSFIHHEGS